MSVLARLRARRAGGAGEPRVPEGSPRVEIDLGASVSAGAVWAITLGAGLATTALCWWAGAPWPALVLAAGLLAGMLATPRSLLPALWFAVIGYLLLIGDAEIGAARPLWVIATIASVHACLAGTRLVQNLGPHGRIQLSALRIRAHSLWRAQAVAQVVGVLAWWPIALVQPWLAAAAVVGVVALAWLLLTPTRTPARSTAGAPSPPPSAPPTAPPTRRAGL